jgi:hypothetical protein
MKQNKAPRPEELPAEFYKSFSEMMKKDLMEMFA